MPVKKKMGAPYGNTNAEKPPKDIKKNRTFKCTDAEWTAIESSAKEMEITVSEFIRRAALNYFPDDDFEDEYRNFDYMEDTNEYYFE